MNGKILNASVLAMALLIGGVGVSSAYNGLGTGTGRPDLTDQQKTALDQMHELRINGDFEGAEALREEAGFPQVGKGMRGFGNSGEMNAHRKVVQTALENNDYNAYVIAVAGSPMEGNVTPEIFADMVQAQQFRNSGDYEGARDIIRELGIGGSRGYRVGFGRGNCMNDSDE